MTSNSLTENEEHNITPHILKTIFGLHTSVIFRPKYVCFPVHLLGPVIPDPSGQLAELIVYITSTRVGLYSHQILLRGLAPHNKLQMIWHSMPKVSHNLVIMLKS